MLSVAKANRGFWCAEMKSFRGGRPRNCIHHHLLRRRHRRQQRPPHRHRRRRLKSKTTRRPRAAAGPLHGNPFVATIFRQNPFQTGSRSSACQLPLGISGTYVPTETPGDGWREGLPSQSGLSSTLAARGALSSWNRNRSRGANLGGKRIAPRPSRNSLVQLARNQPEASAPAVSPAPFSGAEPLPVDSPPVVVTVGAAEPAAHSCAAGN